MEESYYIQSQKGCEYMLPIQIDLPKNFLEEEIRCGYRISSLEALAVALANIDPIIKFVGNITFIILLLAAPCWVQCDTKALFHGMTILIL